MINPTVSVIVPCRNEKEYIEDCIKSIFNQIELSNKIEVIVVDGNSNDGTENILKNLLVEFPNLKVVNNPKQTTPFALNIGIMESNGDYICIFGAHAEYADDFLMNAIDLMNNHPEADCVGGPIISKGTNSFGIATALAMSNLIGVGNAKHRFPEYEGYAEMACFPIFRKAVFDKIGKYDGSLTRNQDDEFCFRLRRSGGKVFISPKVKSTYYVRNSITGLFKQYFQYGYWRVIVLRKHKSPISYRQFIPVIFYLFVAILVVISILLKNALIGLFIPALYLASIAGYSLVHLKKNNVKIVLLIIISIIILHFSYACGFMAGVFKSVFGSKKNY